MSSPMVMQMRITPRAEVVNDKIITAAAAALDALRADPGFTGPDDYPENKNNAIRGHVDNLSLSIPRIQAMKPGFERNYECGGLAILVSEIHELLAQ